MHRFFILLTITTCIISCNSNNSDAGDCSKQDYFTGNWQDLESSGWSYKICFNSGNELSENDSLSVEYLGSAMSDDTTLYKSSIDVRLLSTFTEVTMGKFKPSAKEMNNVRQVILKMKKNSSLVLKFDQQKGADISEFPRKIYFIKIKTIS